MRLAPAQPKYTAEYQNRINNEMRLADQKNLKKGQRIVAADGTEIVLISPNGTLYKIQVADDGTLSTTAV